MSSKNSFMNLIEKYFKGGELVNEESTNLIHAQCHSIQEEDSEPLKKPSQEVDLASDSHHSFQAISKEVNGQEPTKHSIFEKELSFTVLSRPFTIRLALLITLISTFIMVVARSIDFVLIVRISTQMQNYSVVLSSVLLPILFCVLLWPIVWFKMFVTKSITKEMRKFPLKKFAILGLLSCISNLIQVVPSDGDLNVALNQSIIINNVILSFLFLSVRYNILHIGGITLVAIGIGLDLLPTFLHSSSMGGPTKTNRHNSFGLFSSFYQLLWELLRMSKLRKRSIWMFAPYSAFNISQFGEYLANGFQCFAGINSMKGDLCEYVWAVILVFMCFNLAFNISKLFVFKYGSSTLAVISAALRLVLSSVGFMIPVLAGPATSSHLTALDLEALVILVLGVIMYSATEEKRLKVDPIHEWLKKYLSETVRKKWEELKELVKQLVRR
nr:unnamed protein product [Naegleria fowleri]